MDTHDLILLGLVDRAHRKVSAISNCLPNDALAPRDPDWLSSVKDRYIELGEAIAETERHIASKS